MTICSSCDAHRILEVCVMLFDQVVDCELRWRSFLLIAVCARMRHTTARASKILARKMIKLSLACPDCVVYVVFCVHRMRSFSELRGVQYIRVFCIYKSKAQSNSASETLLLLVIALQAKHFFELIDGCNR